MPGASATPWEDPGDALLSAFEGADGALRLIRAACDLDPRQTEHIGEALRTSGVPALVLWGERDQFLPIDTVALPGAHFTPHPA